MTEYSLRSLPSGSKLILIGDWFRNPGQGWQVVCYFLNKNKEPFRKKMPIDLLPALIPGTEYPRLSAEYVTRGYTGRFNVPSVNGWVKMTYADLPKSLLRLDEFHDQIASQVIYRIPIDNRVIWLPAAELARMLFLHSSEVARAAVYQGNTWQLAKSHHVEWIGEVTFTSNVPVNYLNSLEYRKFFAWLLFDKEAEESFCSIFNCLNQQASVQGDHERWTFDFDPPDLSSCEISWSGFTGQEKLGEAHHCYIRQILSVAGVRAPQLEIITFSHPDDCFYIESESDQEEPSKGKERKKPPAVNPKEIDLHNPPKGGKKRHLIRISSAGFHFDTELDLRRSPRQVKALPKGEKDKLDEHQDEETEEGTLGIAEGSNHGKKPRGDFNHLEKPNLIEAPEKFAFFAALLEQLKSKFSWQISTRYGEVPEKQCRSAHLVDDRRRMYCHAIVERDADSKSHMLEIELKKKEALSTLIYVTDSSEKTLTSILDALMTSDTSLNYRAMQWKRKKNTELTIARYYLDHPDKAIKDETEALEAWVARAVLKIQKL